MVSCSSNLIKSNYIADNLLPEFSAQMPDYPRKGSSAQSVDEYMLRKLQKERTEKDCERARATVVINLQTYFGSPYGDLNDEQVKILSPFLEEIRHQIGPYVGQVKKNYKRLRPYEYIGNLKPCVKKEESFSYPSGHTVLATVYSLVLIDIFPDKIESLKNRAHQISQDRVLGGVHHPSDIEGGKKLGSMLYAKLKESKAYNDDVARYRSLLGL